MHICRPHTHTRGGGGRAEGGTAEAASVALSSLSLSVVLSAQFVGLLRGSEQLDYNAMHILVFFLFFFLSFVLASAGKTGHGEEEGEGGEEERQASAEVLSNA